MQGGQLAAGDDNRSQASRPAIKRRALPWPLQPLQLTEGAAVASSSTATLCACEPTGRLPFARCAPGARGPSPPALQAAWRWRPPGAPPTSLPPPPTSTPREGAASWLLLASPPSSASAKAGASPPPPRVARARSLPPPPGAWSGAGEPPHLARTQPESALGDGCRPGGGQPRPRQGGQAPACSSTAGVVAGTGGGERYACARVWPLSRCCCCLGLLRRSTSRRAGRSPGPERAAAIVTGGQGSRGWARCGPGMTRAGGRMLARWSAAPNDAARRAGPRRASAPSRPQTACRPEREAPAAE